MTRYHTAHSASAPRQPIIQAQQRKTIRYNHLVANCIIFYNVCAMTRVLHELTQDGYSVDEDAVAALSPYQTEHINRFGRYHLDLSRTPAPIDYDTPILSPSRRSS